MGLFDDEEWGHTVEQSGDFARVEQLAGHLLLVFPIGYIEHHPTRFTQPGKKSDVIVCDLVDLDAADEQTGARGKIYRNAWWRQSQLIIMLRPFVGKKVMGRLGKGISRNGLNPPWILKDATGEPGTIDIARQWAAANPNFAVSPFTAPTLPAAPPAPAPQPQYQAPQPQFQQPQFGPPPGAYQQPQYQQSPPNYAPAPQPQFQAPPQPTYTAPPVAVNNYAPLQPAPDPWATAAPAAQYQQQTQQYAGPPAFPVDGSKAMPENMLAMMRAERERREAGYPNQAQQPDTPPF